MGTPQQKECSTCKIKSHLFNPVCLCADPVEMRAVGIGDEAALSVGQRAALKRLPFLRHRYYGSVLESAVADRIARSASLSDLFEHVGSRAGSWSEVSDFAGRGIFRGLEYDITTPGQLWKKHWKYGEDVLVPRYVR